MTERENVLALLGRKDNNIELLSVVKMLISNSNFSFIHDTNVVKEIWDDRLAVAEMLTEKVIYNDGLLITIDNLRFFDLDKIRVSDCSFDTEKCLIFTDEHISTVIGIIFFPNP